VLIRQYRYAIDRWIWELPAGSLEPGEDPVAGARRECHEEIGMVPDTVEHLGTFYPTPGFCDEKMIFFRMSGLSKPAEPAALDEDEQIEPRVFEVFEVRQRLRRGEIVDMKTAFGLTLI
jgi:ADP-ribose pyrophosphatase